MQRFWSVTSGDEVLKRLPEFETLNISQQVTALSTVLRDNLRKMHFGNEREAARSLNQEKC